MRIFPEIGDPDYKRTLYSADSGKEFTVGFWRARPVEEMVVPIVGDKTPQKIITFKTLVSIFCDGKVLWWADVSGNDEIQSIILALESINIQLDYSFKNLTWLGGEHGFPFIDPRKLSEL